MGLDNVELMVPFVRTLTEAEKVIALLAEHGLERGERISSGGADSALRIVMMCEAAVERDPRGRSSSNTSTASRSARTT